MLLTRRLAFGGLSTALVLIAISLSYISPTADLALFTLSSFFIAMTVIETDFRTAAIAYAASGILITAMYGIYFSVPFLVLFGVFPLLKGFLEKHLGKIPSYVLKGVYFCILLTMFLFVFQTESAAIMTRWDSLLPTGALAVFQSVWVAFAAALAVMFLYDFALTLLIVFYSKRIKKASDKK
jgi:hypothetical protein